MSDVFPASPTDPELSRAVLFATPKRILVVEDDPDMSDLLRVVLSEYDTRVTGSFVRAVEMAAGGRFDLYLVDHRLPDGTGIDLCRTIRRDDSSTPIIVCSADARPAVRREALEAGAQGFLVKPADPDSIAGEVRAQVLAGEGRSMGALAVELRAVQEVLAERLERHGAVLGRIEHDLGAARERLLQAREALLRARARAAFIQGGGVPAHFEDLFPAILRRAAS